MVWEGRKQPSTDLKVGLGCSDSVGCGKGAWPLERAQSLLNEWLVEASNLAQSPSFLSLAQDCTVSLDPTQERLDYKAQMSSGPSLGANRCPKVVEEHGDTPWFSSKGSLSLVNETLVIEATSFQGMMNLSSTSMGWGPALLLLLLCLFLRRVRPMKSCVIWG